VSIIVLFIEQRLLIKIILRYQKKLKILQGLLIKKVKFKILDRNFTIYLRYFSKNIDFELDLNQICNFFKFFD